MKIRKNDTVLVIAGKNRGKKGKVRFAYPKDELVLVEGINFIKKHSRARGAVRQAGIIEMEAPIHISDVMLLCNKCNHPARVGFRFLADGRKVRVCLLGGAGFFLALLDLVHDKKEVIPSLMEHYGYKNIMQVPRLEKVVLNIGLGEAIQNAKALDAAEKDLAAISGQHPIITHAKKSIAAFKLRSGMSIGLKVTLRGKRMYHFFDKLVNAVLPRMREFRGVSRDAFDSRGNYTLGFKEQIVFPEVEYDKIDKVRGLEVSIVTTAKTDEEGRHLLELLGMPFSRD